MKLWGSGDKSVFEMRIEFLPDPDRGAAATADDSASWGAFELWVSGVNLCAHYAEGERADAVHWYLLPLLEWLANNWDPLFHEERLPFPSRAGDAVRQLQRNPEAPQWMSDEEAVDYETRGREWWMRHCLQAARFGGLFPNVSLRRCRELVEVSWDDAQLPGAPDSYSFVATTGSARLSPAAVADPIYAVMAEAAAFLVAQRPASERLRRLADAVAGIKKSDRREPRLAWMAGLGRELAEIERRWRRVVEALTSAGKTAAASILRAAPESPVVLGSCDATLMFGSVAPTISEKDVVALAGKMVELFDERGDQSKLRALAGEEPLESREAQPWDQGYRLALRAHEAFDGLGMRIAGVVDAKRIVSELGVFADEVALADDQVRAVAVAGPRHKPCIVLNRSHYSYGHPERTRFTLAHELCHLLFDRAYGTQLALASGPWAPARLEARANAFAAMFLMPPSLVQQMLGADGARLETADDVRGLAVAMGTSFLATVEHICNLGYIDANKRDRLKEERDDELRKTRH